jgi:hypothetical protein
MIVEHCQRWREMRGSYRPAGETFDPRCYEVGELLDDTTPRAYVERHHYSGSYPAARFRFGLYEAGRLAGVAVFSHPTNEKVLSPFPGERGQAAELGRFVLDDGVKGNGESWFIARCFERLRERGQVGVVSFSDPVPRTSIAGAQVFPGHVGGIYQATNGIYVGRATARTLRLLPDGRVFSARSAQKIRAREKGHEYAEELLARAALQLGLILPLAGEDPRAWLRRWLPVLTRPLRHGGNLRYLWGLTAGARRHLLGSRSRAGVVIPQPYPKLLHAPLGGHGGASNW